MFNSLKSKAEKDIIDMLAAEAKNKTLQEVLHNFSVFTPRQNITRFLNRYEMFKKILPHHGSIFEFGVFQGAGLLSWLHFSSIFEPYNISRKVVGFDSFKGFPETSKKDSPTSKKGMLKSNWERTLKTTLELHQRNSALPHIKKSEIIVGDICKTLPVYLKRNPHTLIALAYIDVDIYKPTKVILKNIIRRMPKGSILAFDELNDPLDKGETIALLESINLNRYKILRNSFDSYPSYIEIQ